MRSGRVDGFVPSKHGFRFANRWPAQPLFSFGYRNLLRISVGDASNGLCGGMVFAACDFFLDHVEPPPDEEPPAAGSPLFRYLRRRLFDSFHLPWGVLQYYSWMSHADGRGSLAERTMRVTWPRAQAAIDAGRPAPLGLIRVHSRHPARLGQNHQVLAYGYDWDDAAGTLRVALYDPNHPGADDVTLTIRSGHLSSPDAIIQSTGEPCRGFLALPYRPRGRSACAVL